jgi:hypothetical protein
MDERPVRDRPGERVQAEAEGGRDPEVGAGPAEAPEEVRLLLVARPDLASVGRDEVDGEEVVDRQPVLALEPPHAAAEREAGDARVRDDTDRADEPDRLRLTVELAEERAAVHPGRALGGVDAHAVHPRQVDHDPVVAGREAGDAVAAAADRDRELLLAGEADRSGDVGCARGAGDELRVAVDHPVPDDACLVVAGVVAADDLPGEHIGEAADRGGGWWHVNHRILVGGRVEGQAVPRALSFQGLGTLSALALLAQLVEHLHGKEGVDGSSPSEGLWRLPAKAGFLSSALVLLRVAHSSSKCWLSGNGSQTLTEWDFSIAGGQHITRLVIAPYAYHR